MIPDIYQEARTRVQQAHRIGLADSFEIARACSTLLARHDTECYGRDLAIRVLDKLEHVDRQTHPIWNDLVEAAGLHPYINKALLAGSASLRHEYHQSDFMPGYFLHREQQYLSALLADGNSLVVSAPTSFGKSLLIEEVVASKAYSNIVVIQPTLALLDETRKKLSKYGDTYQLVVSTHQRPSSGRNIFLFTGERVVEYDSFPDIDFFVIDEFYKLSLERDDERATVLNHALYRLLKMTDRFYLLGPNIKRIPDQFIDEHHAFWHRSDYATVAVDVEKIYEGMQWKERDPGRKQGLYELLVGLNEPTIIYCSGPPKATDLANEYKKYLAAIGRLQEHPTAAKECADIIEWVSQNIHAGWCLADVLKHGIAFHHGHLPRHLGSSIVDAFNRGHVKYLFCTSTLIEGVNTTARNVVLFDRQKGRKPIDFFDYKNIVGRSGRMNFHFVGKVFEFHKNPAQLELEVDVPLFTQRNAPLELLVQLDKEDIQTDAMHRLDGYEGLEPELRAVIKKNSGLPVKGQIDLVRELEGNLERYNRVLKWRTLPKFEELKATIELAWKYFLKSSDSKAGIASPAQLAFMANQYTRGKTVKYLIAANLDSDYWRQQAPDETERVQRVVLLVLGVFRQWFEFKLPKLLVGLSEIQAYVFAKHNMDAGNYSYFCALLENSFFKGALSVLMDYDVPASAIRKVEMLFTGEEEWNEIQDRLRATDLESLGLLEYEAKKLRTALRW